MKSALGKSLLGAAIAFAVLASLTVLTRTEAFAQIRAALTKNVDEPWRTPWDTRSQILPPSGCYGTSDCYNYQGAASNAMFDLRPVPAGKRWIVQSATGGMSSGSGSNISIELRSNRSIILFDGLKWLYSGPFQTYTSFNSAVFSAPVVAAFGPGEVPTVRVVGMPQITGYTVIVFNGYLIDATN